MHDDVLANANKSLKEQKLSANRGVWSRDNPQRAEKPASRFRSPKGSGIAR